MNYKLELVRLDNVDLKIKVINLVTRLSNKDLGEAVKDINKLISGQKVYLEFDSDVENILNDVIKELLELTVWVADVYVDGNVLGGGMQFG
ncbi:MAG: hypothetical protein N4A72_11550 [Bacteroidales bacterium]|jgi:hypothetical protein|nr:hypothetical protein [Bacteroidales bacterium]